jgi:hypothetical protein
MKKTIGYFFVGATMLISAATISSCSKDDDADPVLPPIGGYSSSDSVAASNLIAKWSFENNLTESKSGLAGVGTAVNYSAGKKGQGWQGSSTVASYAVYTAPASIAAALTSYSIAFWVNTDSMKLPLAVPTQGHGAQGLLSIVDAGGFWGGANLFFENRDPSHGDSLRLKLLVRNTRTGVVWQDQGPILWIPNSLNKWIHVTLTYDAGTGRFSAYVNGALGGKMEVPYGPVSGGTYIQYLDNPGDINNGNGAAIYGPVQMPASTKIVLGSHQFTTTPPLNTGGTQQPWATTYAGKMDEVRIYKSALSASDISALYQLESAGR